ncbi:MAG: polymerase delta subunit [Myxococcaceae bacterium]|nr:polymerase delta subunit [Myxococcaceae bacterium]
MSLDALIEAARAGKFPPVTVIAGSERLIADRTVEALKLAALAGDAGGFNSDVFQGASVSAQALINAARTLPMFASSRFLLVRGAEAIAASEIDALCAYMRKPSPEACLVLLSEKLDGRSKLAKTAIELGIWFEAVPPRPADLPQMAQGEARARGHALSFDAAQALVDAVGTDLSALDDALERLSLFVGDGQAIDLDAVERSVTHARTASVWALVDAVGARNGKVALSTAASLLSNREEPLRILALIARQLRTLARMRSALKSGLKEAEAAQKAGAPPFKARELAQLAKRFGDVQLSRAFQTIAEADLQLKGSKVPGPRVLERALMELCR